MSLILTNTLGILTSSQPCLVTAESNELADELWFRTPALDESLIKKIRKIQLQTTGHDQGSADFPEAGSWSWFDIVILDSVDTKEPKVKDGLTLLWMSHTNALGVGEDTTISGPIFDRTHDLFKALEPGNCLAVRVCARFLGWENHATSGILTLHLSEKEKALPLPDTDKVATLEGISADKAKLADAFDTYLNEATPTDAPPAYSLVRTMLLPGPLRADQAKGLDDVPLQLLSLDGGGVRGISSLYILQAIMKKLSSDPNTKPADYFHMIAGTSTGGLIAIMLGRLRMTIQECIDAYINLASEIFAGNVLQKAENMATTGARYKGQNFEKALKSFIKRRTGDENALLYEPTGSNQCKVFVVSVNAQNITNQSAEHFRSYASRFPDQYSNVKIWEAARATSAAPTYFPSITIGSTEFIDGGFKFNNPSILLMGEVNAEFGFARPRGCFVTIGTGVQPNVGMDHRPKSLRNVPGYLKSVLEATLKIVTDCERTHQLAEDLFPPETYWRFNAGVRIGIDWQPLIDMDDYKKMNELVTLTINYLAKPEAVESVASCASRLTRVGM